LCPWGLASLQLSDDRLDISLEMPVLLCQLANILFENALSYPGHLQLPPCLNKFSIELGSAVRGACRKVSNPASSCCK
jgi:hypothetical protein